LRSDWYRTGVKHESKRAIKTGYWKMTGSPKKIMDEEKLIGYKNYLVFYRSGGEKTNWVLHEYKTTPKEEVGFLSSYLVFCYYWLHISSKIMKRVILIRRSDLLYVGNLCHLLFTQATKQW